jgi:hypothetical protein
VKRCRTVQRLGVVVDAEIELESCHLKRDRLTALRVADLRGRRERQSQNDNQSSKSVRAHIPQSLDGASPPMVHRSIALNTLDRLFELDTQ